MRLNEKRRSSGLAGSVPVLAALLVAGATSAGTAQDSGVQPDFGTIDVIAGGEDSARQLGSDCEGWISLDEPDHSVSTGESLTVAAFSSEDTVLVVRTPAGGFLCDDDGGAGDNPEVFIAASDAGSYDIWVGSYNEYMQVPASLELFPTPAELPGSREPDILLQGEFDPYEARFEIGGRYMATNLNGRVCEGFVSGDGPEFAFGLQQDAEPVSILIGAHGGNVDTTLVVRSPSGSWTCNDDFTGKDPLISIRQPENGTYLVWIGAYDLDDVGRQARLSVSTGTADQAVPMPESDFPGPAQATGFLVSGAGHVLSNHHVIEGCGALTVRRQGQGEVEAEVIASNDSADLALLRIGADGALPHATFRGGLPARLGEEIAILGFPGDAEHGPTFTTGVVSSLSGFDGNLQDFQHNAETGYGSSGSPIIDRSGNVIGVVTGSLSNGYRESDPVNVNYGIRGQIAQVFLKLNNVPYSQARPGSDREWVGIAEDAQAFTAIVYCYM